MKWQDGMWAAQTFLITGVLMGYEFMQLNTKLEKQISFTNELLQIYVVLILQLKSK